jgi:phosphoadenosine phosphosulfate reductase
MKNSVQQLFEKYAGLVGEALLRPILTHDFPGKIAVVSSFGTESAVLLRMVATVNPTTPVFLINTGKLFPETLLYRDELARRLGLTNVQMIGPSDEELDSDDKDSLLWHTDSRACCTLRKVNPLQKALGPYEAWVTGRKRYQGGLRTALPSIEESGGRVKVNPLAEMTFEQIEAEFTTHHLPRHPLVEKGYLSVGCTTCSKRITAITSDRRAGRLELDEHGECGIHLLSR